MSYNSNLTRNRILECSKIEFQEKGFINANLRKIAKEAHVTTGAMYNHFGGKNELFEALVAPAAGKLLELVKEKHNNYKELRKKSGVKEADSFSSETTAWMLDYIYDHFDSMKLIVCCSAGTAYSNYLDKIVSIEIESGRQYMNSGDENTVEDSFFIQVFCETGIRNLFEVVRHDLTRTQAFSYMEKLRVFLFAGWDAVYGIGADDSSGPKNI